MKQLPNKKKLSFGGAIFGNTRGKASVYNGDFSRSQGFNNTSYNGSIRKKLDKSNAGSGWMSRGM